MSGINNEPRETKKKGRNKGRLRQTLEKIPLLRRLLRNPFLKVLSLVFAILLWAMVMSQTNPPRAKVVYDVPVELTGVTDLNARGLSLATEGGELPASVDVRLEVPMNDLGRATADNVHATIDFSRITTTGDYTLPVNLSRPPLRGPPPGHDRGHALPVPDHRPRDGGQPRRLRRCAGRPHRP